MLKPFSRTLLALALLSPLTVQAQQDDAARQKELEAARTDLRRAAQRVSRLRKACRNASRAGPPQRRWQQRAAGLGMAGDRRAADVAAAPLHRLLSGAVLMIAEFP